MVEPFKNCQTPNKEKAAPEKSSGIKKSFLKLRPLLSLARIKIQKSSNTFNHLYKATGGEVEETMFININISIARIKLTLDFLT